MEAEMTVDHTEFIEKVRRDITGGGSSCIFYDGKKLLSRRGNSKKAQLISQNNLVGIYDGKSSNADIIDDCTEFVEQYQTKQVAQSRRLAKALGMDNT